MEGSIEVKNERLKAGKGINRTVIIAYFLISSILLPFVYGPLLFLLYSLFNLFFGDRSLGWVPIVSFLFYSLFEFMLASIILKKSTLSPVTQDVGKEYSNEAIKNVSITQN